MNIEKLKKDLAAAQQQIKAYAQQVEFNREQMHRWAGRADTFAEQIAELEKATEPPKP